MGALTAIRSGAFGASLLAAVAFAAPGFAQSPAEICAGSGAVADDRALLGAADAAERSLARGAADVGALTVESGTRTQAADPSALARYCAAAGEAVRVSPSGAALQAKALLLAALRYAETAQDQATAARAAYRLGLASLDIDAGRGGRGLGSAARGSEVQAEKVAVLGETDCAALEAGDGTPRAALYCAAARAEGAQLPAVAALANLRLARLSLTEAVAQTDLADSLRDEARRGAENGLAAAEGIAEPKLRATLTGRLGEALLDAGGGSPGQIARITVAMAGSPDPGAAAQAHALIGRMALATGDRAAASAAFQQAVFLEGQRAQPLRMADWLLLLAEAEPGRRAALVIQAFRALQAVRPLLPLTDPITEESNFGLRMRPVFEAAVAVQLAEPAGDEDQARIAGAQQIVEAYREAELQSVFGSNCVPPRNPVRPADLRAGETLLYPILLDDRVELIFAGGRPGEAPRYDRIVSPVRLGREGVARLVDAYVEAAASGDEEGTRAPARALYDLLIKPITGKLMVGGTLIVIPDGPLRALPFAALQGDDGRFLIEQTRLSVAPALSYSQPGSERGTRPLSVVAASLQREVVLPAGRFALLSGTGEEAAVAAGEKGTLIRDFREADLRRALSRGRVDVLHLATHAAFNGRSDRSFIVANDEAIPISDLRSLIGSDRARGDELDLVVLSACETAVGDEQASMGLAGAAVQAGAQSAIASLWQVDDAGTVALMKGFYDAYRRGEGKAEALRDAQLTLIRGGGDLSSPTIWAAFTLLGGWR